MKTNNHTYLVDFLDRVLASVKQQGKLADENKNDEEIRKLMVEEKELTARAMRQLHKDGYVYMVKRTHGSRELNTYYISFKGILFLLQDGYKGKLRRERNKERILSLQSWVIALGTLAAGIYSMIQFGQWINTLIK